MPTTGKLSSFARSTPARADRRARGPLAVLAALLMALVSTVGAALLPATAAPQSPRGSRSLEGVLERTVVDGPVGLGASDGARSRRLPDPSSDEIVTVRGRHGRMTVPSQTVRGLRAGQRVRVTVTSRTEAALPSEEARVKALVRDGAAAVSSVRAIAPPNAVSVLGTHRLLVVPMSWDGRKPTLTSPSAITDALRPSDAYWSTVSAGRIRMPRAQTLVTGVRTTARPRCSDDTYADFFRMEDEARAFLDSSPRTAVRQNQFDHIVLLLPDMGPTCWGGLGRIGGGDSSPTTIWLNNNVSLRVVAHELGHNLGLNHSGEYYCWDAGSQVPLSRTCLQRAYADPYDLMGGSYSGRTGSISATHMDQMHLLGPNGVQEVRNVDRRRYTLARLTRSTLEGNAPSDALRGLTVPALGGQLLVEYRTPSGLDWWIAGQGRTRTGVVMRGVGLGVAPNENADEEDLLTTPGHGTSWLPGQTLSTPDGRAVITVVSIGAGSAVVEVTQR